MIACLSSGRDGAGPDIPPSFDGLTFAYARAFSEFAWHPRGDIRAHPQFHRIFGETASSDLAQPCRDHACDNSSLDGRSHTRRVHHGHRRVRIANHNSRQGAVRVALEVGQRSPPTQSGASVGQTTDHLLGQALARLAIRCHRRPESRGNRALCKSMSSSAFFREIDLTILFVLLPLPAITGTYGPRDMPEHAMDGSPVASRNSCAIGFEAGRFQWFSRRR